MFLRTIGEVMAMAYVTEVLGWMEASLFVVHCDLIKACSEFYFINRQSPFLVALIEELFAFTGFT